MKLIILLAIILLSLIWHVQVAKAKLISDEKAIRAIIGEAANQGYVGMLAVAEAIRNRGTLDGVYGLHAKHIDNQPSWIWNWARMAWRNSKGSDIVKGATHWESDLNKEPYWAKHMRVTAYVGNHVFYKRK